MVVIKPTRDFTSEDRVSYAANNAAKSRQNTAINRYREEISTGKLMPRTGKAAKTVQEYKENHCSAMGLGIGPRLHSECPFSSIADQYASTGQESLQVAIEAAYRQVYGNLRPNSSQRSNELDKTAGPSIILHIKQAWGMFVFCFFVPLAGNGPT